MSPFNLQMRPNCPSPATSMASPTNSNPGNRPGGSGSKPTPDSATKSPASSSTTASGTKPTENPPTLTPGRKTSTKVKHRRSQKRSTSDRQIGTALRRLRLMSGTRPHSPVGPKTRTRWLSSPTKSISVRPESGKHMRATNQPEFGKTPRWRYGPSNIATGTASIPPPKTTNRSSLTTSPQKRTLRIQCKVGFALPRCYEKAAISRR